MSNEVSVRQQIFDLQDKLFHNLRIMDNKYFKLQNELNINQVKQWYYQHLLVKLIQTFLVSNSIHIPKYILNYKDCFRDDNEMLKLFPILIRFDDVNNAVLKSVFKSLLLALDTQDLKYVVNDDNQDWIIFI